MQCLRALCPSEKDWDDALPYARLALRSSVNTSRGDSPFFLNHRRDARLPPTVALGCLVADPRPISISGYRSDLLQRLVDAQSYALARLLKPREQQKEYCDQRRDTDTDFQVAELVWLFTASAAQCGGLSNTYPRPWSGPFRIVSVTSPGVFMLENATTSSRLQQPVHAHRLKPYYAGLKRPEPDFSVPDDNFSPDMEGELALQSAFQSEDVIGIVQDLIDATENPPPAARKIEHNARRRPLHAAPLRRSPQHLAHVLRCA